MELAEMKQEAIKRMELLNLSKNCIMDFEKNNKVWESEDIGYLYTVNDEEQKMIKELEKKYGFLVYHVIHTFTKLGELYNLLIITKYKEEWQTEINDLTNNYIFCYVYNKDDICFSEFGTIGIQKNIGGLIRIS